VLDWQEMASGLAFPEGPVALDDGSVILVEMQRKTLTRVAPDGVLEVIAELGGGPNGAALGPDGRCYVCNNGGLLFREADGVSIPDRVPADYAGGWIDAVDLATGRREILYRECRGQPLCGPNDLVFDRHGGFYFTDSGKVRKRDRDRGAVFYAHSDGGHIRRVAFPVEGANGIGLSPDDATLYVAESVTGRIWAYDVAGPGELTTAPGGAPWQSGRLLFAAPYFAVFDSLAVDAAGNICVADIPTGAITVISPQGTLLEQHRTPDAFTTNICFGEADLGRAYVTLSSTGRLVSARWPRAGAPLHWLNRFPAPPA
jgi:gluconolactonase